MSETKLEEAKRIREEKKALNERQKQLNAELAEGKEERKEARKSQAEARKEVQAAKSELAKLTASTYKTFTGKDSEEIGDLADGILEKATELATAIRKFADAQDTIDGL